MTAPLELVRRYLAAYAARDLAGVEALLSPEVVLRDWKIRVVGKAAALEQTRLNFEAVQSLEIEMLAAYERPGGVAAELRIRIDDRDEIHVVDVFDLDAEGRIAAIRAYLGRG